MCGRECHRWHLFGGRRFDAKAAMRGAGTIAGLALALALSLAVSTRDAHAYDGAVHQHLTFIAARQYNRCVADTQLARLTPLQMRYVAKANANRADRAWWKRLFRWNYYDRSEQSPRAVLWLIETRIHDTYEDTLRRLKNARDLSRRFTNLGRIVNHLQDATTPAHVVPIFTTRFWRFSFSDRFNAYPVDEEALIHALGDDCTAVRGLDGKFERLLMETAERTLASIQDPIHGMPATWEAFWKLDKDDDDFGSYGNAGNHFGREAAFPCAENGATANPNTPRRKRGRDCVLLKDDPIYAEYAAARHLDAVKATMAAVSIMQESLQPIVFRAPEPPTQQHRDRVLAAGSSGARTAIPSTDSQQ